MMSTEIETVSAFVAGAPPGELADVINDIKCLAPSTITSLGPALQSHNESQFTTVKLPGASTPVLISSYNSLGANRYFDPSTSTSFAYDHSTQKASASQSHVLDSQHTDLMKALLKGLESHVAEHYPEASYGVYPFDNDSKIAIVVVANKYSPNNFWNGRWRSSYVLTPSTSSIVGNVKVDVHYYEDGNVRLLTEKPVSLTGDGAPGIIREIAKTEKKVQEELNKGFTNLSEGAFKGLRRQLPITRQKIEWDKIAGYRLGQDIGGGAQRR